MSSCPLRILIIRRDNIGDLICTTPLLHALRSKYPHAFIVVLASSYNAEILKGNHDVDEVFIFPKRHQKSEKNPLVRLWKRCSLVQKIRKHRFDHIILANGGWRYARYLGGKQLIGFRERGKSDRQQPDIIVPWEAEHEVLKMGRLGAVLGIEAPMGPMHLFPDSSHQEKEQARLFQLGWNSHQKTVGLHISSRQPEQRWSPESFVALAKKLTIEEKVQLLLFWSPGDAHNRMHPGDDAQAAWILEQLKGCAIFPSPAQNLIELVAGISLVDQIICSDGGALHVAAALQKPIICFFGPSSPQEWHPWKVPYELLQPVSRKVADLSVEEVMDAFYHLNRRI